MQQRLKPAAKGDHINVGSSSASARSPADDVLHLRCGFKAYLLRQSVQRLGAGREGGGEGRRGEEPPHQVAGLQASAQGVEAPGVGPNGHLREEVRQGCVSQIPGHLYICKRASIFHS